MMLEVSERQALATTSVIRDPQELSGQLMVVNVDAGTCKLCGPIDGPIRTSARPATQPATSMATPKPAAR